MIEQGTAGSGRVHRSTLWKVGAVAAFPVSMIVYCAFAWYGFETIRPWSLFWYFVALRAFAMGICLVLERTLPFDTASLEPRELRTDIVFYLFNNFVLIPFFSLTYVKGVAYLVANYSIFAVFDTRGMSVVASSLLIFFALEFGAYWGHRFVHTNHFFWRGHATHHSPTRMYWLNNSRNNILSYIVTYIVVVTPAYLLAATSEFLILRQALFLILAPFQHVNADMRLGPLNYVLSVAPNHRYHHSAHPENANANFGLMTVVFDVLFGTFINGAHWEDEPRKEMGLFKPIPGYKKHSFVFQETVPYRRSFWPKQAGDVAPVTKQRRW